MKSEQQTIEYFWDYIAKKISRNISEMAIILIVGVIIFLIMDKFDIGYNSTDSAIHGRSDLKLHVDDMTGCHFLSVPSGGIIRREDSQGNHICTGHENE